MHATGNEIKNPIKKADKIFTELKQASDWVQTVMAVAQQKQQKYVDKMIIRTPKYKIKNKVWLTLKNITTATENQKSDESRLNIPFSKI